MTNRLWCRGERLQVLTLLMSLKAAVGIIILAREIIFGANGKIEASGQDGKYNPLGITAEAVRRRRRLIIIVSTTAINRRSKSKKLFIQILRQNRNGTDGIAGQTRQALAARHG